VSLSKLRMKEEVGGGERKNQHGQRYRVVIVFMSRGITGSPRVGGKAEKGAKPIKWREKNLSRFLEKGRAREDNQRGYLRGRGLKKGDGKTLSKSL